MRLPLFFLGLCGHAHVAFIEFSHYTFRKESCRKYSPLGLYIGYLSNVLVAGVPPVFIFCVFYVENLADSQ